MIALGLEFEKVFVIFTVILAVFLGLNLYKVIRFIINRRQKSALLVQKSNKYKLSRFVPQKIKNLFVSLRQKLNGLRLVKFTVKYAKKLVNVVLKPFKYLKSTRLGLIKAIYVVNLVLILAMSYLFYDMFVVPLNVQYMSIEENAVWSDQSEPFVITFDRPINTKEIGLDFYPEIRGNWVLEDNGIGLFKRTAKFVPQESILPESEISIYIAKISNLFQTKPDWDKAIDLKSPNITVLSQTYPQNDAVDFGINEELVFTLSQEDSVVYSWNVKVEPETEFEITRGIDAAGDAEKAKQLRIKFKNNLPQNAKYKVTLERVMHTIDIASKEILSSQDPAIVSELNFTTIKAPSLSGIEPAGEGVKTSAVIKLNFDYEMPQEEALKAVSVEPKIDYTATWLDGKTLELKPNKGLSKNTTYKVKVAKGLTSLKGGIIENDIEHTFKTIGYVTVVGFSPSNNSSGRSINTNISVTFNQEVNKADAQAKFSTNPATTGTFSWSGNTMTYNPSNALGYQSTYTISVAAGVKTVNGLDSQQSYSSKFTTEAKVFSLAIPFTKQPYRYACNVTAAKMALAYKGVGRSVDQIHSAIGTDSTPWDPNARVWGNPNSRFVGTLDGGGSGPAGTGGYGVHWGPISSYIQGQGRSTSIKSGWNTADLLREVEAGNPVIIWAHNGYSGSGSNISWSTSGGSSVYAVKGMHSYVVRGYIGSVENPTSILVVDPARGNRTLTIGYFNGLWGTFGRTAVVVR